MGGNGYGALWAGRGGVGPEPSHLRRGPPGARTGCESGVLWEVGGLDSWWSGVRAGRRRRSTEPPARRRVDWRCWSHRRCGGNRRVVCGREGGRAGMGRERERDRSMDWPWSVAPALPTTALRGSAEWGWAPSRRRHGGRGDGCARPVGRRASHCHTRLNGVPTLGGSGVRGGAVSRAAGWVRPPEGPVVVRRRSGPSVVGVDVWGRESVGGGGQ